MHYKEKLGILKKHGDIAKMSSVTMIADMTPKVMKNALKRIMNNEVSENQVLGFLDTTAMRSGKEGFLFLEDGIGYTETFDKPKYFSYIDIKSMNVRDGKLIVKLKGGKERYITSAYVNKKALYAYFDEILKLDGFVEKLPVYDSDTPRTNTENRAENNHLETAGLVFGNVSNASTNYGADKFSTPRGHGFAAENANHLVDKVQNADFFGQEKVQLVGEAKDPQTGRIVKDGADRIVNGVNIQTKYCSSGSKCIGECFEDGKLRYLNQDGSPMQIEVPSDKYSDAVKAMENRIKRGEVPGVTNPEEAKNIVRKGHFTYEQAKNIAKAGTVESITYDAVNGAIIASSAMGISAMITMATSIWNGEDLDVALKTATYTGLKIGGTTFVTAILAGQFTKAGMNSALVKSSELIVGKMKTETVELLVNAFGKGKNIYGAAAMTKAAKMLRGNMITGIASVVVLSSADVVNIFRGRISGRQLFKNVTNTTASVAGGTAGWVGGAAAGAAVGSAVPVIGTAIGGVVGSIVGAVAGGSVAGKATEKVLDIFLEDDADEMVLIIEKKFEVLASDYLLNQMEAEEVVKQLGDEISGKTLKEMFASENQEEFAEELLLPLIEKVISERQFVSLPTQEQLLESLSIVSEELSTIAES